MKKILSAAVIVAVAIAFSSCGGSSSGATGLNNANSVTGTVRSASGDPIPGTTVFIPGVAINASTNASKATRMFIKSVTASDGTVCEDPPAADSSLAAGCSAADGTFNVDTSAITSNPTQIVFQRGSLRMVMNLNCSADPCVLGSDVTTFGNSATWPRVAVVTGFYDKMEDVLSKLADADRSDETNGGYGRVGNTTGNFIYGSEFGSNMTIIDGTGGTAPVENVPEIGTYHTWDEYFGALPLVSDGSPVYDVVFINCGNAYESVLSTPANLTILQDYVNAGGRLYVTDLSYDFINQPFPGAMDFEGDTNATTPGAIGAAETSGLTVNAAVNSTPFRSWLQSVMVNSSDGTTPGNPDTDCTFDPTTAYSQAPSAVNAGGLIPLGDFLGGWAHMVGAWAGDTDTTIWISSGAGVTFDGLVDRPLTISRPVGSNGGGIIYSSYHTAESCPTLYFWPQERVLQYLIFEAF
jgi:hypothetical protein